jgi:selenocysteine-specific elongation factor
MRHFIVGTAGHIDHGKSALVLALTGTDPDRLKEEKARGITIDLGFAHWREGSVTFSFVDVPGHERFVKNMLAGVGGIDAVALVVAADESVMPQTREHFEICRLLDVPAGIVVLTKADLVDEETIELVRMETRELVAGSFLADAPVLAVSARTGQGLGPLREALVTLARRTPARTAGGPARLPVDRAFTVKGFGTVVTGTLLSGRVGVDDELALLPAGRPVKVRGVQVHGDVAREAVAGQRAALNLGGIEVHDVGRGDTLVTPGTLEPGRMLDARLQVVPGGSGVRHGARVRFHQGTAEILGRVALAALVTGPGEAGEPHTVAEVGGGRDAYVRVRLESAAVLTRGDRFVLRAYSPPVTIAGGLVLDPHPARGAIRTPAARFRFESLDPRLWPTAEAVDRALTTLLAERGAAGLARSAMVTRGGLAPESVEAVIGRLEHTGLAVRAGDVLVAPGVLEDLGRRVLAMLGDHHRAEPLSEGLPREEVRGRVFARAGDGVFERVVTDLQQGGRLAGRDRLALASHRVSLSADEERARQAIDAAFRAGGLRPPEPQAVATAHGIAPDVLDRLLKLLVRQRVLVRVDTLLFSEQALQQLKAEVSSLRAAAPDGQARIDVATFKERYGVSRKYAIPLLEYLDRERVTRRVGDARVVI